MWPLWPLNVVYYLRHMVECESLVALFLSHRCHFSVDTLQRDKIDESEFGLFGWRKTLLSVRLLTFFCHWKRLPIRLNKYWIHSHRSYECCTVFLYDYQNVLCISTFNHAIYIGHCTFGYPVLLFFLSRPLWYLLLCVYINTPSLCICMTIRNTYILSMLPMPWTSLGNLLSMGK